MKILLKHTLKFIVFSILFFGTNAHATVPIEESLQKKYKQINVLHANFQQRLTHRESGSVEQRQGTIIFEKPLNVRWETKDPHPELLLITDTEIWNYLPDEEVAYKYEPNLMQDMQTLIEVITGQAKLGEDFEIKTLGKEGELTVLQLFPYEPTPEMVEAVIGIDEKSMLIKKASIIDFYGNINTLLFNEIKTNVKLAKDTFDFTPPEGIDVEENKKPVRN